MSIFIVAPFAGVWIEILLKGCDVGEVVVAPFAGVWIEISWKLQILKISRVAPFAGVWIEIYNHNTGLIYLKSHPSRVCGLKS